MKDKYGETIYCSRCRREIVDNEDLYIDRRGMVYCTKCHKNQEFMEYSKIDSETLGQRTPFTAINNVDTGQYDNRMS